MRRRTVVASAALIAALALAGLPAPAGSETPSTRDAASATFTAVVSSAGGSAPAARATPDAALGSAGALSATAPFSEPGKRPKGPRTRPQVELPASSSGKEWKKPKYKITGEATFYNIGSTAMRLPYGTVVVVCGNGGCIQRTITDYGPTKTSRIIDLYMPDFFAICGCPSWSGTTTVTVSVY
jgi:3D (Asp-Asp-Asp) domain-containing protein